MVSSILFTDTSLEITYSEEKQFICMDWKGRQNIKTVKNGCNKLIKFLGEVKCNKILNDNTHVVGSWSDASEWVATQCLPNLEKAGLKYIAWVNSPSVHSRLSTERALSLNKSLVVVTFPDAEAAKKWLMSI